jgi:fructose-1-phosphate kinase PfkB-like protein
MTSRTTVLAVVISLALIGALVVAGSVVLTAMGKPSLPGSIESIGAGAVGGLTALLASTRSTPPTDPQ